MSSYLITTVRDAWKPSLGILNAYLMYHIYDVIMFTLQVFFHKNSDLIFSTSFDKTARIWFKQGGTLNSSYKILTRLQESIK